MCSIKFTGYFTLKKKYHFYASSVKYLLIPEL